MVQYNFTHHALRSYSLTIAHKLKKAGLSFSDALKKGWKIAKLKFQKITEFQYIKIETGEIRKATGNTFSYYISKQNELVVKYFDVEKILIALLEQ